MNIQGLIKSAKEKSVWDFGNKVLYDLCEKYPDHKDPDVIVAKIWLIGRSYAAAIERRKDKSEENDIFYEKIVVDALKKSDLDSMLETIREYHKVTEINLDKILEVHKQLVEIFFDITGLKKRSLASKYLHFHIPNLFYIYDSRANKALSQLLNRLQLTPIKRLKLPNENFDNEYAKFFMKLHFLQNSIYQETNIILTPREMDNILLK